MPSIARLHRGKTALAVVDIQERLLPAMFEADRVKANALRLARAASILGVPVVASEQYPKGLGPTVAELAEAIPCFKPIDKLCFSAAGTSVFMKALHAKGVQSVLLCGIEAHVCVTLTCLDLLENNIQVFVAHDATSSRTRENWELSATRMKQAGAVIVSTEMAIFELLNGADSPDFKSILEIVK
jgi:nicotinamidase-related amidase